MLTKLKCCAVFFLIAVLFFGCSVPISSGDIEKMMIPPKGTGDEIEIKKVISEHAGSFELVYPQRGEYRSAVIIKDLDSDGTDEAIVFYKKTDTSEIGVYAMFLKKENDKWENVDEICNNSLDLDMVDFGDVMGDGHLEIFLSWGDLISQYKVNVAHYDDEKINVIYEENAVSDFKFEDFDDDNKKEMMLLLQSPQRESYVKFVKYDAVTKSFDNFGQINLQHDIYEYSNVVFGRIFESQVGIVIDELRTDGKTATDIVYWDNQKRTLIAPLLSEMSLYNQTIRSKSSYSKDVNSDGLIDIPIEVYSLLSTGSSNSTSLTQDISKEEECPITNWSNYSIQNNSFNISSCQMINDSESYYINMPRDWEGKVVGQIDNKNRILTVSYITKENNTTTVGNAIFKIKAFSNYSWENLSDNTNKYLKILSNDTTTYGVSVYQSSGECVIDAETIKNSFFLM